MSVPRTWRNRRALYSLEGSKCQKCGKYYFPGRTRCLDCNTSGLENHNFSGTGKVATYSWVYTPPKGFNNRIPYCLAIVELDEGPKLTTQLVAVEEGDVEIGMPVEFSFRKISSEGDEGVITYGFKFRPKNYPNHLKKK